jgi:predicted ATPase
MGEGAEKRRDALMSRPDEADERFIGRAIALIGAMNLAEKTAKTLSDAIARVQETLDAVEKLIGEIDALPAAVRRTHHVRKTARSAACLRNEIIAILVEASK